MNRKCFEATRMPSARIGFCLTFHGWMGRAISWDACPMMIGG